MVGEKSAAPSRPIELGRFERARLSEPDTHEQRYSAGRGSRQRIVSTSTPPAKLEGEGKSAAEYVSEGRR
jgi:hypothetical protein